MSRAGLASASVTETGARLADEIGFDQLNMGLLAQRLGVKSPSLYKHVDSLADLAHRIATLAATELGDAIRDATQGCSGRDALVAAAQAMRSYVKEHPGRYVAINSARATGSADPFAHASGRLLDAFAAILRGYELEPSQQIHALRLLRSTMHGFVDLEMVGGFRTDADTDESFAWSIDFLDHGLRATADELRTRSSAPEAPPPKRRPR